MPDRASRWRRFWMLPRAEKYVVLSLAWRLPLVDASLRMRGLRRTRRWLLRGTDRPPVGARSSTSELRDAQRYAALAALVAGRAVGPASCLRQALVVEQWLRRRGLPGELRIGVRNGDATAFHAHAWVELDGVALAQPALQYAAIPAVAEHL